MTVTAVADLRAEHRRGQALMAVAATCWSLAGVGQRELTVDVPMQVAGRAVFAMVTLLGLVALMERNRRGVAGAFRSIGVAGVAVAGCFAAASGLFIFALNHTSVAHVLFIQAASPMVAALLARVVLGERLSPRTWLAMVVALAGVALMIGGRGGGGAVGDAASLVMMLAFAVGIVIARHRRDVSMAPATCLAQVILLAAFAPFADVGQVGGGDLTILAGLGVVQMGVGLALFTAGARLIPAAEVALISLLEVVLGPLWVWLAFAEQPDAATLAGGAVVMVAVALQALGEARAPGPAAGRDPPRIA